MPAATAPSNIRAFVHWKEAAVYAGEEIECIITLKNISKAPETSDEDESHVPVPVPNGSLADRKPSNMPAAAATSSRRGMPPSRGHRPTLSLNVVSAASRAELHAAPPPAKAPNSAIQPGKGHGRSLSIISLGSDVPSDGRTHSGIAAGKRPARGHVRSASLQFSPRVSSQTSTGLPLGGSRQPSPLYESATPPAVPEAGSEPMPIRPARRRPGTVSAGNTPQLDRPPSQDKAQVQGQFNRDFRFPAKQPGPNSPSSQQERPRPHRIPSTRRSVQQRPVSPRPPEGWSGPLSNLNPVTRVLSESSISGTPRSSGEFYSISNHSDETLTSELPVQQQQQNGRLLTKPIHSRRQSRSPSYNHERAPEPETLMMGYAQTMGHFTLDGSLVNAAPFEEVKRKGVQGGGGVVGIEHSKRSSGMFGAFGWGNIGESLSGLLGADDMSSMAQMKATASSKTIPLLSTPQSLLFVDLSLDPGESRSFSYRFILPRGLPPSHRGRAMKVNYHLTIGVQRPGGQAIKHIEIPFRVLGSYNSRGEALGHDLMSPYVFLQDVAHTESVTWASSPPLGSQHSFSPRNIPHGRKPAKQSLEDFLRYTERLLERSKDGRSSGALLSPSSPTSLSPTTSRKQSLADQMPCTIKECIDFAILRSNFTDTSTNRSKPSEAPRASPNRFNIARSGQPVAVLTLLRPAYRLGEAVIGTVDFTAPRPSAGTPPPVATYATVVELETVERVDPSLALRSSTSISRVTRKVHASLHGNTLFARRICFNLTIPPTATPSFETTGVSLLWGLKIHFTTQRQQQQQAHGLGIDGGEQEDGDEQLLEEIGSDERGTVLIAREWLLADSFEVAVPLRVYGTPTGLDGVPLESEALVV
ncbi:hypothetical protein M433DRAFT_58906 [Acidomyces richmondensis BFW]|nr:MAG: hypothetical protein FE78DRAFT_152958 [Acidomyces sp. 'richmondensis']KYG49578.1 hypothetical protein M433DRAFT_58906 [Acidomyces richmondensis BFW]